MRLVQTLLVRDEADVVDAQIAFHLDAGVDFVIATDNRSRDGTREILERHAREGHLHLIDEPGDDLRQSEWVTRMARLAATDFGADWVLNTDADEFWWPQGSSLKDVLAEIPPRYGVVRGAWRNFVPRPDGEEHFAERMTVRLARPAFHHHPLSTHSKSAHRAAVDVRIGRGNHEAFGAGLLPLRGWYPYEILHFPVRSLEHCVRKYVTQFVALEKNAEKGIPNHMAEAHRAYRLGRLEDFYAPLVVDDDALRRGLGDGTLALDTRLRDALRRVAGRERDPRLSAASTSPRPPATPVSTRRSGSRTWRSLSAPASTTSTRGSARSSEVRCRGCEVSCDEAFAREQPPAGLEPAPRVRPHPPRRARPLPRSPSPCTGSQALGWPMAKGRDSWDYLVYYLQLFDSEPPFSELQVFRTPITPLVVGLPMDLGGTLLVELVFGLLFATSVVAWSATALTFGRIPALGSAVLLLGYPAWATLYHQASSDGVFATAIALWALLLAHTLDRPSTWRFAALGAGVAALVLTRPANQVLIPVALAPLLLPVSWRQPADLVGGLPGGGDRAARRVGRAQRRSLRRHDRRSRRARVGAVPARLPRRQDDLAGERRGLAPARRAHRAGRAREGAAREPRRAARRLPAERLELRDGAADRAHRTVCSAATRTTTCSSTPLSRRSASTRAPMCAALRTRSGSS